MPFFSDYPRKMSPAQKISARQRIIGPTRPPGHMNDISPVISEEIRKLGGAQVSDVSREISVDNHQSGENIFLAQRVGS